MSATIPTVCAYACVINMMKISDPIKWQIVWYKNSNKNKGTHTHTEPHRHIDTENRMKCQSGEWNE